MMAPLSELSPVFPLSRSRERVPDRAGEGGCIRGLHSLKLCLSHKETPSSGASRHLLPQAGEGEMQLPLA